jgi:hypothetical protein
MNNLRSISLGLCGAVALLVALQGCGDDSDNATPPKDVTPTAGTNSGGKSNGNAGANDGGTDTGTGNTGNGGTGNTGNGGTGNTGNTGDGGNEPVAGSGSGGDPNIPDPVCDLPERGDDGCYNCPEDREQAQWLNRCVDSDCVEFDDEKLVKLGGDRTAPLPDLPN